MQVRPAAPAHPGDWPPGPPADGAGPSHPGDEEWVRLRPGSRCACCVLTWSGGLRSPAFLFPGRWGLAVLATPSLEPLGHSHPQASASWGQEVCWPCPARSPPCAPPVRPHRPRPPTSQHPVAVLRVPAWESGHSPPALALGHPLTGNGTRSLGPGRAGQPLTWREVPDSGQPARRGGACWETRPRQSPAPQP